MKLCNLQTFLLPLIGWILDFQIDNKRLPETLNDLVKNKSVERNYNCERILKRIQEDGFIIYYKLKTNDSFEIKILKKDSFLLYDSFSKLVSYYQDNEFKYELNLTD
jgi:hypothetical protein